MNKLVKVMSVECALAIENRVQKKANRMCPCKVGVVDEVIDAILAEFAEVESCGGCVRCRLHFAKAAMNRAFVRICAGK